MIKRFTPKASDYTMRMAVVQAQMVKLKKQMDVLAAEEASLKGYLMNYFDQGTTEVDFGNKTVEVSFGSTTRTYLNQEKAKVLLEKAGKRIPTFEAEVVTFKCKVAK